MVGTHFATYSGRSLGIHRGMKGGRGTNKGILSVFPRPSHLKDLLRPAGRMMKLRRLLL